MRCYLLSWDEGQIQGTLISTQLNGSLVGDNECII
jgi:hypothetical protein